MSESFENKVESLVNTLGQDIAFLANDEDEYNDGLIIAAVILLDQGVGVDDGDFEPVSVLVMEPEDEDEFDPFDDEDDEIWPPFTDDFSWEDDDDEEDELDDLLSEEDPEDQDLFEDDIDYRQQADGRVL